MTPIPVILSEAKELLVTFGDSLQEILRFAQNDKNQIHNYYKE